MARLSNPKNLVKSSKSFKKSKITKNKKDDSNSEETNSDESAENEKESKSSLLSDSKKAFGTDDLYKVLNLDKTKASNADIKKAYYKLSLKCHPDKQNDDSKKEESNFKFQVLGKIYSILSDEEKKKIYDETGCIDGEDQLFGSADTNWEEHWRSMFKKITKKDIETFFEKYKNSIEERNDLAEYYERFEGDFNLILQYMYSSDLSIDEDRFKEILNEMIDNGQLKKYELFMNDTKKKSNKRKAIYKQEAAEAEELKKEMGIDESQDSLRNAILSRRQNANENFLDNLEKKYAKIESTKKNSKKSKKNSEESEQSSEEEDEDENESEVESEDEEELKVKKPRRALIKKKTNNKSSSAKKVKRL